MEYMFHKNIMAKGFCMKNLVKLFGIIALFVVIGFSFAACKKDALDGTTWKGNSLGQEMVIKFNNPNCIVTLDNGLSVKGSYAISGITVTMALENNEKITGTLAGDTLSLTEDGETVKFTKQ
jgi:hypothetical protein